MKTSNYGFLSGLKAFKYRYQNCGAGANIITNPLTGKLQIILPNNEILHESEISERFINQKNHNENENHK